MTPSFFDLPLYSLLAAFFTCTSGKKLIVKLLMYNERSQEFWRSMQIFAEEIEGSLSESLGIQVADALQIRCPSAIDAFSVASDCQDESLGPNINECFSSSQFLLGDLCGAGGNGLPHPP